MNLIMWEFNKNEKLYQHKSFIIQIILKLFQGYGIYMNGSYFWNRHKSIIYDIL